MILEEDDTIIEEDVFKSAGSIQAPGIIKTFMSLLISELLLLSFDVFSYL